MLFIFRFLHLCYARLILLLMSALIIYICAMLGAPQLLFIFRFIYLCYARCPPATNPSTLGLTPSEISLKMIHENCNRNQKQHQQYVCAGSGTTRGQIGVTLLREAVLMLKKEEACLVTVKMESNGTQSCRRG